MYNSIYINSEPFIVIEVKRATLFEWNRDPSGWLKMFYIFICMVIKTMISLLKSQSIAIEVRIVKIMNLKGPRKLLGACPSASPMTERTKAGAILRQNWSW